MSMISRVGFGCGRLRSGFEKSASIKIVQDALNLGVRYFDTSPSYGLGDSEKVLGEALTGYNEDIFVVTKYGLAHENVNFLNKNIRPVIKKITKSFYRPKTKKFLLSNSRSIGSFSLDGFSNSLDKSLSALKMNSLGGLLLHEPSSVDPVQSLREELYKSTKTGIIKKLGVGTGGAYSNLPDFGSIRQYLFWGEIPLYEGANDLKCVVHGVFRYWSEEDFRKWVEVGAINYFDRHLLKSVGGDVGYDSFWLWLILFYFEVDVLISTDSAKKFNNLIKNLVSLERHFYDKKNLNLELKSELIKIRTTGKFFSNK